MSYRRFVSRPCFVLEHFISMSPPRPGVSMGFHMGVSENLECLLGIDRRKGGDGARRVINY